MDKPEKNDIIDVNIHGMSHDGRGVGRLESGITAFVQGAVTGQAVKALVLTAKKRMLECLCVGVVKKSEFEIQPYCEHAQDLALQDNASINKDISSCSKKSPCFEASECMQSNACGGCPLMPLAYEKQLEEKTNLVRNALVRIGHLSDFDLDANRQSSVQEDKKAKNINKIERLLPILSPYDLPKFDENNKEKTLTNFRNKMEFAFQVVSINKEAEEQMQSTPSFNASVNASIHATNANKTQKKSKTPLYTTKLGLRKRASHDIIEVTACKLQKPITMDIVSEVRAYCKNKELSFLRYLVIRTPSTGQVTVELITWPLAKEKNSAQKEAKAILDIANTVLAVNSRNGGVHGFIHSVRQNKLDVAYGERIMREWGETSISENIKLIGMQKHIPLLLGNKAFFQVNTDMTNLLYSVVYAFASHVLAEKNNRIWDIYCGVGSITTCLAPLTRENKKTYIPVGSLDKETLNALCPLKKKHLSGKKDKENIAHTDTPLEVNNKGKNKKQESNLVVEKHSEISTKAPYPFLFGLESVSSATALARKNTDKYQGIFETADAKYLAQYLKKYDVPNLIVLDPPRAGLDEHVVHALLKYSIDYCILVSCNPTTLARDLDLLSKKYTICAVQAVDLFPHSTHIETVTLLARK